MQNVKLLDWLGLITLVIMFGSAFMFTKLAVQDFPPAIVAGGRIVIAALVLLPIALIRKEKFGFVRNTWMLIIALAITGDCLPFYLISWGQQSVDSSIAGILMAIMPLTTIFLAHFFVKGEPLTRYRVIGFVLGFVGIIILLGPAAYAKLESGSHEFTSMLAILIAALSYAVNMILAKRLPQESILAISTVVLVFASLIMLPFLLAMNDKWWLDMTSIGFSSLILLGLFPTGLATIVYFAVIARAGPSFLSQINYLIPVWAVLMGIIFLSEHIDLGAFIALAVILLGIAVAQRQKPSLVKY